jgi:S-adenosylmethionine synthetase
MDLVIESIGGTPVARRRIELVERKGLGHPDTICDSVVEAASDALGRLYLERAGVIAHCNIERHLNSAA